MPGQLDWRGVAVERPAHLSGMDTNSSAPSSGSRRLERLLTVAELSDHLGVAVATIYGWRVDGKGPRGLRIGRHVRFAVDDGMLESITATGSAGPHDVRVMAGGQPARASRQVRASRSTWPDA